MSGNKCSYMLCGKSRRDDPQLRKFSFPVKDQERCKTWIKNSGNAALCELSPNTLKTKFLCYSHFQPEDISTKNLVITAVPTPYFSHATLDRKQNRRDYTDKADPYANPTPTTSGLRILKSGDLYIVSPVKDKEETRSQSATVSEDSDWEKEVFPLNYQNPLPLKDSPQKTKLKSKLLCLRKELKSKRSLLSQYKKKIDSRVTGKPITLRDLNSLSPFSRALVKMQLYHKPRMAFTKEEKKVAISMFYKSPSLYRFLRRNNVVLPSISTIRMWISDFNAKAGFDKKLLNRITQKALTMTDLEKQCVMMFDEMDIKQFLEYSKKLDSIEGFEDLGKFGRKSALAKKVLVIMARGLYAQWKIPIAYFFSEKPVSADKLLNIITTGLKVMEKTSLRPIATVCDQSTTNQRLYKMLHATSSNPYFFVEKKQYFALFDVPHLIKSLRNNLLNGFFIYENQIVSLDAIDKVFELDKQSKTGKALLKITEKHLKPNAFQKMNVKLATQLFSNSVAAALKTAVKTKEMHSSALETANFVKKIDNLFDALNSQRLYETKPCNSALSSSNICAQSALEEGFRIFTLLVKQDKIKGTLSRPPCFQGMLQTINAVNLIYLNGLHNGFSFLLTRRLNQDPLENQFSKYRQSGGYNRNPTARTFRAAFKMSVTINLLKPPRSNCEEDADKDILIAETADDVYQDFEDDSDSSFSLSPISHSSVSDEDIHENSSLENSAVVYFGGYLLKKCLDKYKCNLCKEFLQDDLNCEVNENESLIFFKNYQIKTSSFCRLKVPSPTLKQFTLISMKYFSKYLKKYWVKRGFGKHIENLLLKKLHAILPDWFIENECKEHREFMLKLLIRTLIFKECKSYASSIKSDENAKTSKRTNKLTILQHS